MFDSVKIILEINNVLNKVSFCKVLNRIYDGPSNNATSISADTLLEKRFDIPCEDKLAVI